MSSASVRSLYAEHWNQTVEPMKRHSSARASASLAIALLISSPPVQAQHGQATDAQLERMRQRINARLDTVHAAARFPGVAFGAAFSNGRSFGIAVGWADTVRQEPMRPDHRMPQGSVGKTYYAAVALQLVDEKKLDLDAPISRYLAAEPWWRDPAGRTRLPNGENITVRQLLNHTSGVVRYEFDPAFLEDLTANPLREWTPADRISYVLDRAPPFVAGEGWEYSDTNYILLGLIIERVTGRTLYEEVVRRIFDAFALRNTIPADRPRLPGVAQGYAGPNNPFGGFDAILEDGVFRLNPQLEWAGGGMISTAEDLARWGLLTWSGSAYSHTLLAEAMRGTETRGLGQGMRYGLGVMIHTTPLGESRGHSGFFPGYLTEVRYYPDHGFAVAIQFNTSVGRSIGRNPGALLQDLAGIVYEELTAHRERP